MVLFDHDPGLLHLQDHLGANVLLRVGRGYREVAFLVARFVAEVRAFVAPRVPHPFRGLDVVISLMGILVEANAIEDEELRFRPEVRDIANAGALQVIFSLGRDVAGVA